jgi:hypothetical protein
MGNSKKVRTTRRVKKQAPTTIPELKRSFDALEREVDTILASGSGSSAARVKRFQEAWRRIFGRPVDATAAEAYLAVKSRRAPKKTRKVQRGGMAPVDFQTRPGVDGSYGSFLPYVSQGLRFYDTINQEGMFKDCGVKDSSPNVPADMGSNKATLSGGGARPFPATVPATFAQDFQDAWLGRSTGASPAADQTKLSYL